MKLLKTVRQMKENTFEQECRSIIDSHISMLEKLVGPIDQEERDKKIRKMVSICRKARELSDVEFELTAEELAEGLDIKAFLEQFKSKFKDFQGFIERVQGGSIGKIANHFLDPIIIPIFEARIKASVAYTPPSQGIDSMDSPLAGGSKCGLEPGKGRIEARKKYTVNELCNLLNIKEEIKKKFASIVGKAKGEQLRIMQIPMKDGTVPLSSFLAVQGLPVEERESSVRKLFLKLQEYIPGQDMSYLEAGLRIQMDMDRQFRQILDHTQYAKLTGLIEDMLDQIEPGADKVKPRLGELALNLELCASQIDQVRETVKKGQVEAFQTLSIPDSKGSKPLEIIITIETLPQEEKQKAFWKLMGILKEKIPGRGSTYGEEIERIKFEIEISLKKFLSEHQYQELKQMKIDYLDIQLEN